eukprot:scaffold5943_cov22-Tisochrysis_lutea.AAC.6
MQTHRATAVSTQCGSHAHTEQQLCQYSVAAVLTQSNSCANTVRQPRSHRAAPSHSKDIFASKPTQTTAHKPLQDRSVCKQANTQQSSEKKACMQACTDGMCEHATLCRLEMTESERTHSRAVFARKLCRQKKRRKSLRQPRGHEYEGCAGSMREHANLCRTEQVFARKPSQRGKKSTTLQQGSTGTPSGSPFGHNWPSPLPTTTALLAHSSHCLAEPPGPWHHGSPGTLHDRPTANQQ